MPCHLVLVACSLLCPSHGGGINLRAFSGHLSPGPGGVGSVPTRDGPVPALCWGRRPGSCLRAALPNWGLAASSVGLWHVPCQQREWHSLMLCEGKWLSVSETWLQSRVCSLLGVGPRQMGVLSLGVLSCKVEHGTPTVKG